ncbi:hypothetical protein GPJ56_006089 [Histomonas meleagridis]|uniref:uncharacterized protein n=1 Tax=Histomonas meleagridis TaxID=135588 RepID=UPI003559E4E2|nr:hypothetical protein GPJ56_006089 [Histomonas meleagridis]KAH0807196.1 hypothetical protein GO595_000372 [Histomonas meleagridis]
MQNNQPLFHPQLSSTYAQVTHHHPDEIGKTQPNEIGVRLCPFPFHSIKPETTTFPGDSIPRCHGCGAFYNKFNQRNLSCYICSLCGTKNTTSIPIDPNLPEYRDEAYDGIPSKMYRIRNKFVPTDFYIISLSLIKKIPDILDIIISSYSSCYEYKQIGICFLHGSITVVKFRESLQLQTFSDFVPTCKISQLFAAMTGFCHYIQEIKTMISKIQINEHGNCAKFAIDFGIDVSTPFGTSLRYILDANDFHNMASEDCYFKALDVCKKGTQISLAVFADNIQYKSPLFQFPSITGGFLEFIPPGSDLQKIKSILLPSLTRSIFHDTFIYARAPDGYSITDYAGTGLMRSSKSVMTPKIEAGQTFYFKFNTQGMKQSTLQFVIFFTTELGLKRFRVITVQIMEQQAIDYDLINRYIAGLISHSYINEGKKNAEKLLEDMKKKFNNFDPSVFNSSNFLLQSDSIMFLYKTSLTLRDGRTSS